MAGDDYANMINRWSSGLSTYGRNYESYFFGPEVVRTNGGNLYPDLEPHRYISSPRHYGRRN